ncbi:MAG: hypothetical protein ACRYGC_05030, partial [Janthinobacterium lividum]
GRAAGGEASGDRTCVPVGRRGVLLAASGLLLAGAARGAAVPGAAGAAAGPGVAATVRLRPGGVADLVTLRAEGARSRLLLDAEPVLLPGAPERIAALPVAGRQVVVAGVALPSGQVLAVLAGWDGAQVRVLGVESWDWHGSGPRRLGLRVVAVPDDRRVRLLYEAVLSTPREDGPAGRVVVRHEAWTDVLAWQEGGAMRSEPLRPVLAGTWQARMAGTRAAVAALLAAPCTDVGVEALAATGLLDPLGRVAPG